MTAIVGLVQDGQVWMGADSYMERRNLTYTLAAPKIFFRDEPESERRILFGVTGDVMLLQLLREELVIPAREAEQSSLSYMAQGLGKAIYNCVSSHLDQIRRKEWYNYAIPVTI